MRSGDAPPLLNLPARLVTRLVAEHQRWGLWTPVGLGLGIALYFSLTVEPPLWLGPTAVVVVAVAAVFGRHRLPMLVAALAALTVAVGFTTAHLRALSVAAPMLQRSQTSAQVTGRVIGVELMAVGFRLLLTELTIDRLAHEATPERIRLRLNARYPPPVPGTMIRFRAGLFPPPAPAEPGGFDFQRQAFFDGLGGVGFVQGAWVEVEAPPPGLWRAAMAVMERLRLYIAGRVTAAVSDPDAAALTVALMNGAQTGIAEPVMVDFRNSGLAHILSISGLHIALVAGLVFFVVRALLALIEPLALRFPIKKWAAVAGLLAAAAYMLVVGAPVPTLRSVLMTGFMMVAIMVERNPFSMRLTAFSTVVVMLMQPESLLGPSFQMSFGAVVALIAAYEVANPILHRWRLGGRGWRGPALYVGGIFFSSVVATLATLPYSLYHFQQIAFYGLFSNMLAIPVTSFWVMPWALIAYLAMPFGLDAWPLVAMGWGDWVIVWLAHVFGSLPGAALRVTAMPVAGLVLITLGGLWLMLWQTSWRLWGLVGIVAGFATLLTVERPDVLIAADGKEIAVRTADGGLALSGRSVTNYTVQTWLRRDGNGPPPLAPWPKLGPSAGGRLMCDGLGCLYRVRGQVVALIRDAQALAEDCASAGMVVAPMVARRCRAGRVIDLWSLRRGGAHALYLRDGGRVEVHTVREWRGRRLWCP
ncbi:competence protein ComEC [uncultured Gammaproteobacteria bacterium]